MTQEEVYQALLSANVAGGRVYRSIADDDAAYPYIRFRVSQRPLITDLEADQVYRNTYSFQAFGKTVEECDQAISQLKAVLKPLGREIFTDEDDYIDPDTSSHRIISEWYVDEYS